MSKKIVFSVLSALLLLSFVLTACASGSPQAGGQQASVQTDKNASIEVWIDAAREESAGKFVKAYPDKGKLVSLTTTDYGQLPQKILFWNNVGGGWPDASFGGPNIVPLINDA